MASPEDSLGSSCDRAVRRMVRLPASLLEGLSRAICHDIPVNYHGQVPLHPQRRPATVPEEWRFLTSFEVKYGNTHPFFYACRFGQALKLARDESKFLFIYVHAPEHPHAAPFCIDTLCSDLVVEFLDANFVSWGAVADGGEGLRIARSLQVGSFPFCAVVAPTEGDINVVVLQQIEGPISPYEIVEVLQRTIEEQGSAFLSPGGGAKKGKVNVNHRPRAEENDGFREILIEEVVMPAAKDGCGKAGKEKIHGNPATKQPISNPTPTTTAGIKQKDTTLSKIMIRFPNGEQRECNFFTTDRIRSVYKYVDSLKVPGIGIYRLISTFPRKVYGYQQQEMTLKDAGLHPRATLFLELL